MAYRNSYESRRLCAEREPSSPDDLLAPDQNRRISTALPKELENISNARKRRRGQSQPISQPA
jgi:hypothetical protein